VGPSANRIFENLVFPIAADLVYLIYCFIIHYYFGVTTLFSAVPVTRWKRHLREKHSKMHFSSVVFLSACKA